MLTQARRSVVVIEDEAQIRRFVRSALEAEGFAVSEADTAGRGLIEVGTRRPDLAIIDLGLPDRDGVDLIREIRTWSTLPILILSARSLEGEKVRALDAGADDYLTKPFGIGELRARVRAMLRRSQMCGDAGALHAFGDVEADLARHVVRRAGAEIHLTPQEYRLLVQMLTNPGRVLTQAFLIDKVWGPGNRENNHYLRIYVARLRHKLEADPARPRHILTETGVGYRFQPQSPAH